jgi:AhpC/TSA family
MHGHFGIVLLFRGAGCPYCNAQLRAFQRTHDKLAELDVRVLALSVDDRGDDTRTGRQARSRVSRRAQRRRSGHRRRDRRVSEPEPIYIQSTGSILDADGRVLVSACTRAGRSDAWYPKT